MNEGASFVFLWTLTPLLVWSLLNKRRRLKLELRVFDILWTVVIVANVCVARISPIDDPDLGSGIVDSTDSVDSKYDALPAELVNKLKI